MDGYSIARGYRIGCSLRRTLCPFLAVRLRLECLKVAWVIRSTFGLRVLVLYFLAMFTTFAISRFVNLVPLRVAPPKVGIFASY